MYPQLMRLEGGVVLESVGSSVYVKWLCLKLLPQFWSHLYETCYTWSLWCV